MGTVAEKIMNWRLSLTHNEIKNITKVIRYLENRGILLKGTTQKIESEEGGFF